MKEKLYKEVSVTDRLPQTSGYYLTNNGKRLFSDHINVWQQNSNEVPVEWWLEVVKLPSQSDINIMCIQNGNIKSDTDISSYNAGAADILNKIK